MSIHMITLEQACKESPEWLTQPESAGLPGVSTSIRFHAVLRHLVTTLTRSYALDEVLHTLAALMAQALEVDLCVIMLKKQTDLQVCACSSDLSDKGVIVWPVNVDVAMWWRLHAFSMQGQVPRLNTQELEALNPLKNVQYATLLPIPLIAGTECIGLLNCYSSKPLQYSDDDQLVISSIANQAALATAYCLHIEEDGQAYKTMVHAFINDLLAGGVEASLSRRANFLGYDLAKPHTIVLLEMSMMRHDGQHDNLSQEERLALFASVIEQLKHHMQERYPGSLIDDRTPTCTCLFHLDESAFAFEQLNTWLESFIRHMRRERQVAIAAGISNLCLGINEYQRGAIEASEALKLGQSLKPDGGSTCFNALGIYRYIYQFAYENRICDQYQEQIASIVEYDRRKKTKLLATLESYLECGGNIARTSSQLAIHRNTLLQRMERLQKLCILDLEQVQNRLPLLVALKVYQLRVHTC